MPVDIDTRQGMLNPGLLIFGTRSAGWMGARSPEESLVWEENGITYLVISNHLSLDEALKVAESLGK